MRVEIEKYDLVKLRELVRSFPYSAVLPVQPLMLFPTDSGIDVIFRKKPTAERGSSDGGLVIMVEEKSVLWDSHRVPGATRSTGEQGAVSVDAAQGGGKEQEGLVRGRRGGEDRYDIPRATITVVFPTSYTLHPRL